MVLYGIRASVSWNLPLYNPSIYSPFNYSKEHFVYQAELGQNLLKFKNTWITPRFIFFSQNYAPMQCTGPAVWRCEKTLGGNGGISLDLWDLRWETGLRFGFGTMYGVDIKPWRKISQCCSVLLDLKKPRWQTTCYFRMTPISEILLSSDSYMIGRWSLSLHSSISCTLLGWVKIARIGSVGTLSKGGHLRSNLSIMVLASCWSPWKSIWRNKAPTRVAFFVWGQQC
jgi:hypothetical protein